MRLSLNNAQVICNHAPQVGDILSCQALGGNCNDKIAKRPTVKVLNFSDTHNVCCYQPKIQTRFFYTEIFQSVQIEWQTEQTLIRLLH